MCCISGCDISKNLYIFGFESAVAQPRKAENVGEVQRGTDWLNPGVNTFFCSDATRRLWDLARSPGKTKGFAAPISCEIHTFPTPLYGWNSR
jgi:hypothetical protein